MTQFTADYENVYSQWKYELNDSFNFAYDVIDHWAEKSPDKTALFWVNESGGELIRTFSDIRNRSISLAEALYDKGLRKNDVILVMLGREIEWWELFTASIRLGLVFIPVSCRLTHKDLEYRLNKAETACFVTNGENVDKFEMIDHMCPSVRLKCTTDVKLESWLNIGELIDNYPPEFAKPITDGEDTKIAYFTSGTGDLPKMAVHSLRSYSMAHKITGQYWLNLSENDLIWHVGDPGWAKNSWGAFFGPWHMGTAVFVYHANRFEPEKILQFLEKYPVTHLCTSPTAYRMMGESGLEKYKFKTLSHLTAAGEPLNREIIETWKINTGLTIHNGYGQTETALLCADFPGLQTPDGAIGKPAPGIRLEIIDANGNILPANEEGEFAVEIAPQKPYGIFDGYRDGDGDDAPCLCGKYYMTGDRGVKDENGFFWFIGRTDDVIVTSGYRIMPLEVEDALNTHKAILESVVVASPDEIRGEVIKAYVVLAPGFKGSLELEKDLQVYVKKMVAPYKYPRLIEFIDNLPKTMSGKIKRETLRNRELKKNLIS